MKCIYDRDRKAFYLVPQTAADRAVIVNDFGMRSAGDFVLLVRQDVIRSDGVISHLEVSRFLYNKPQPLSTFEKAAVENDPGCAEPDARSGLGTHPSRHDLYANRRSAVLAFIAGLAPGAGDVVTLPLGSNPIDRDDAVTKLPGV